MKTVLFLIQLLFLAGGFFLVDILALGAMGYTEERLPRGLRWFFSVYPYLKVTFVITAALVVYIFARKTLKAMWASSILTLTVLIIPVALTMIPQPDPYDYLEGILPNSPNHQHWGSCQRGEKNATCEFMLITQPSGAQITFDHFKPRAINECDKINISDYAEGSPFLQKLLGDFPTVLETEATQCYRSDKFPATQVLRVAQFVFL